MKAKIHIKALTYGLFAVLCHMSAILLFYLWSINAVHVHTLISECTGMLEYSAMSLNIVLIGSLLIFCAEKNQSTEA